jgi:hypothetical protein
MIFTEKVFEKYFLKYLSEHKINKPSAIQRAYNPLYAEWKNRRSDELGGEYPLEYLNKLYINGDFADYIVGVFENKMKIGDATVEFIDSLPTDKKFALLISAFEKGGRAARLFVADCLETEKSAAAREFLTDILLKYEDYDREVVNAAFNALKRFGPGLDRLLFEKTEDLKELRGEARDMILDILSDCCNSFGDEDDDKYGIQDNDGYDNKYGVQSRDEYDDNRGIQDGGKRGVKNDEKADDKSDGVQNITQSGKKNYAKKIRQAVTEGFLDGGNAMLYANLLGRCGDDESVAVLKEYAASKELSRAEFLEIRNAVERLGGFM